MSVVRIISVKWDGSAHRDSTAVELGQDRHGLWLWMPDDTPVSTSAGTYLARPGLRLFPPDTWWSAYFVPAHPASSRPEQWYVDIMTPASRIDDVITFTDLDLDVERLGGGAVALLDQDEFEQHSATMGYPPELIDRARTTAAWVVQRMQSRTEPFGRASESWLRRAQARTPGSA